MKILELTRVSTSDKGTFGVLLEDSVPFAVTIEKPWRNNKPSVSCIPAGVYICHPIFHERWGETYWLKDPEGNDEFQGRSDIMIHPANVESELRGCIAPGLQFGVVYGKNGVRSSRRALKEIVTKTDFRAFKLYIFDFC